MRVDQEKSLRKIGRAGIRVKCTVIIGFDTEPSRVDEEFIAFAERTRITDVLLNPLVAYPGTDLWKKRLQREGRLFPDADKNLGEVAGLPNFVPVRPIDEIAQELINFYEVIYEPARCLRRAFDQTALLGDTPGRLRWRIPEFHEMQLMLSVIRQRAHVWLSNALDVLALPPHHRLAVADQGLFVPDHAGLCAELFRSPPGGTQARERNGETGTRTRSQYYRALRDFARRRRYLRRSRDCQSDADAGSVE